MKNVTPKELEQIKNHLQTTLENKSRPREYIRGYVGGFILALEMGGLNFTSEDLKKLNDYFLFDIRAKINFTK